MSGKSEQLNLFLAENDGGSGQMIRFMDQVRGKFGKMSGELGQMIRFLDQVCGKSAEIGGKSK